MALEFKIWHKYSLYDLNLCKKFSKATPIDDVIDKVDDKTAFPERVGSWVGILLIRRWTDSCKLDMSRKAP